LILRTVLAGAGDETLLYRAVDGGVGGSGPERPAGGGDLLVDGMDAAVELICHLRQGDVFCGEQGQYRLRLAVHHDILFFRRPRKMAGKFTLPESNNDLGKQAQGPAIPGDLFIKIRSDILRRDGKKIAVPARAQRDQIKIIETMTFEERGKLPVPDHVAGFDRGGGHMLLDGRAECRGGRGAAIAKRIIIAHEFFLHINLYKRVRQGGKQEPGRRGHDHEAIGGKSQLPENIRNLIGEVLWRAGGVETFVTGGLKTLMRPVGECRRISRR